MLNIKNLLLCPECRYILTEELKCNACKNQYTSKYGVFDLVSSKLSNDQQILWKISDEMIEDDTASCQYANKESDWTKDYTARKNKETLESEKKTNDFMTNLIENMSGVVCDLATGRGVMLQKLLNAKNKAFDIVCTDIDKSILAWTRKVKQTSDGRVFYIATDGRYMSIKDDSFDYITSLAAFGNIPDSNKVAKELYRILKPNGKLIIQGGYIEKGSRSHELAKSVGVERGMIEEYLIKDLEDAGFNSIVSNVVAEAIWAENPYDLIPAAGDTQRYFIIQAQRTK